MSDSTLREALERAADWIGRSPHGDNCFVSDHYEADPGNRCNCGKDSLHDRLSEAIAADDAARGTMREQFEAWAQEAELVLTTEGDASDICGTPRTKHADNYVFSKTQWAFSGFSAGAEWQASRAAAPQSVEPEALSDEELADCGLLSELDQPTAPTDAEWLLTQWRDAYAAFKGAFDTPQQRLRMKDEYSTDARRRLRDFDEALRAHIATRPLPAPPTDSEWQHKALVLAGEWVECAYKHAPDGAAIEAFSAHIATRPQGDEWSDTARMLLMEVTAYLHPELPIAKAVAEHLPKYPAPPTKKEQP